MENKAFMTSRERFHAALNLQIPDRVPLDLGGFQTGIPPANIIAMYEAAHHHGFYSKTV